MTANDFHNKFWTPPAPAPVTVRDVYGVDDPKAPEGWEFTGEFRPVVGEQETWLNIFGGKETSSPYNNGPRLILRPCPPQPTLLSVYGTETPRVPVGWVGREFRPPQEGDKFLGGGLGTGGKLEELLTADWFWASPKEPRLILTPTTEADIYRGRVGPDATCTIPEGYKKVAFRVPTEGEYYLSPNWNVVQRSYTNSPATPRIILLKSAPARTPITEKLIPVGYRFVAHRNVRPGETYLTGGGGQKSVWPSIYSLNTTGTFDVIEKIPAPTKLSVYGTATPAIPDGWEEVGFGQVRLNEPFLMFNQVAAECASLADVLQHTPENEPRIILRRIPELKIPEGWKFVRKGLPKRGEWWISLTQAVPYQATVDYRFYNNDVYIVVERIELPTDRVRATRVLEYEGPRAIVKRELDRRSVDSRPKPLYDNYDNVGYITEKSLKIEPI